ncbi:hypothetical protein [Sphingobacterium sp.]|uniref:hypothetical protein n=1 Tax=Sphingobacterium sp. TaxID=341027 RepID=UPI0031DAAEB4
MRSQFLFFIFLFSLSLISSCGQKRKDLNFLEKAYSKAESNPVDALKLLDSIVDPEKSLNRSQYMRYLVVNTLLKHRNYLDIENDTLIFIAADFYKKNQKNAEQVALAYFYAGTVLRQQKKYDLAMQYFKNAEPFAQKSSNNEIIGLVEYNSGDLLAEQGSYEKALIKYSLSSHHYHNSPEKKAYSLSSIGRMYLLLNYPDSAFLYFNESLQLAEKIKNNTLLRHVAESLSVAYEQANNYRESYKYLRYSLSHNTDSKRSSRYNLNFALLFKKWGLGDSTKYYAGKLKKDLNTTDDKYLKASILNFMTNYEKSNKNISAAFNYQTQRIAIIMEIMKERENQSVFKIEQKYNYEQIRKEYYKSLSTRQGFIIILLCCCITVGVLFLIYRAKQKSIQSKISNKIATLTGMKDDLESLVQKKQTDLRREILWRFDITKKFLKLNNEIKRLGKSHTDSGILLKQFNAIVYGNYSQDEQWEIIHQAFKQARPGYSQKIKTLFPELNDTEFRIAILTYAEFSIKEIAIILKQSPNTVQTRRTSLRKKLGIENGGDIAFFIDQSLD